MRIKELVYREVPEFKYWWKSCSVDFKKFNAPSAGCQKTNEAPLLQANILTCPTLDFFFNFRDIILKTNKGATYNLCLFMEADVAFARGEGVNLVKEGRTLLFYL